MTATLAIPSSNVAPALLPLPSLPITVRPGTLADVPFMDKLQKLHGKQVGWMPTATLEGKIRAGQVLIAEESRQPSVDSRQQGPARPVDCGLTTEDARLTTVDSPLSTPLGYCIAQDQYFKRDDVGVIYQMNVAPNRQRGLVGATLLRAQFERSAYGCRLYCCWCAQDIAANRFWEAMGFVPLAFRSGGRVRGSRFVVRGEETDSSAPRTTNAVPPTSSGSRFVVRGEETDSSAPRTTNPVPPTSSARTHIFWQKRIRAGDTSTPWWFPSQTSGGSLREDRLVFPIPPGTHWSDAKPIVLPGMEPISAEQAPKRIARRPKAAAKPEPVQPPPPPLRVRALQFAPPKAAPLPPPTPVERPKSEPRPKQKNDPRLVAAARELRDRWLEQVNAEPHALPMTGKYEVSRTTVHATHAIEARTIPMASGPFLPAPMAA